MISCINAQPSPLPLRSDLQQDRVFAGLVDRVGVNPNHADHLVGDFVERHEGHRAGVVELGQPGDELVGELLHRREEPQPQILAGDVPQKFMDQRFVLGTDRPHKDPPAVLHLEVPLPLRRIGPHREIGGA